MASSRVLSLADPSAFATIYPSAEVELLSLANGRFHAEITQVPLDRVWIHQIHIAQPAIDTIAINRSRRSFGFLTERNSASLLNYGREVQHGEIVLNRSDVVHQRSGADFHYGSVSLPSDDLAAAAEAIVGRDLPDKACNPTVRPSNALMDRLQKLHRSVVNLAHEVPEVLKEEEVIQALETELTHILARCLAEGHSLEPTAGRSRVNAFGRFVEFLEANPNQPLYLVQICKAIGVSERTLRSACEEFLGMGPIRYLNLRRMHQARRALRDSDPSTATVTRIATDHGFWELGRFSVEYRKLFEETPSETLRKKSEPLASGSRQFPPSIHAMQ
jgi:AraC-like DNA-binding protein